jgi:hypothetical protein
MSGLTIFLTRCIGLFTIVLVVALWLRGPAVIERTVADAPVMLAYAIVSLAIGVAMITGHNVWSGGALPVVVTLVGWLIAAKGLLLLLLSPEAMSGTFAQIRYGEHYYLYLTPSLALGLYLAGAGFAAPRAE